MTTEEETRLLGMAKKEANRILEKTLPDAIKFWADRGLSEHATVRILRHAYVMGIGAAVTYILMENAPEKPSETDLSA